MSHYAVVGGGLSGLAAAWKLRDLVGPAASITVLEAGDRLGGKVVSRSMEGWLVEEGPSAFLMRGGALDEFVAGLGLEAELVKPAARGRLLFHNGRLRQVTANPFAMLGRGLLTLGGASRMCLEPFVRSPAPPEESVYEFARRRFGVGVADALVAPMVLGISAGDARNLSVDAVFPEWRGIEERYGSMVRGVMSRPKGSMRMVGLRRGTESLVQAVAQSGRFDVECSTEVSGLEIGHDGIELRVRDGAIRKVSGVILALPPARASAVLTHSDAIRDPLLEITEPPVVVVAVGFLAREAKCVPNAFGVLVPRGQGIRTLGVVFESSLFEARAPTGHVLLKVMLGGGVDPDIEGLTDDELRELVLRELETILGWRSEPTFWHTRRWLQAIPQGGLGHVQRRSRIEAAVEATPCVELAGTGVWGIGVEKAVSAGFRAASRLVG